MGYVPIPPLPVLSREEAARERFRRSITPAADWLTPIAGWAFVLSAIALLYVLIYLAFGEFA